MKKIRIAIKDFLHGIKNIIWYWKVIWKDRNWHYGYMENIMLAKLERWYKVYSGKILLPYQGIEKDLQAMRICIEILKRRRGGWYTEVWHSNYGYKLKFIFEPISDEEYYEMKSEGMTEEEKESHIFMKKCDSVEARDWKVFCSLIEKYFNRWWPRIDF